MYRDKLEFLQTWKESSHRKPLIIHGARQVGKTWLVREFGRLNYEEVAYIDFLNNPRMESLFEQDLDTERILQGLKAESGIDITEDTLIFLDEIQSVPKAITSLKYFYENMPEYHIIVAGSLLGLSINQESSFPVGKVNFMNLYPLSFQEFLRALGEDQLVNLLSSKDYQLMSNFHNKYLDLLKTYYYVGGMPEAVKVYVDTQSWQEVRKVQVNILNAYNSDFGKHAPINVVPRIKQVWDSLPAQLAKENKKYIYGRIQKGARSKDYELAIRWLEDAGLVYKVHNVSSPKIPLRAYIDPEAFKLYMLDVGLLSAMTDLSAKTLLEGSDIFTEFKGALTEQFVLGELRSGVKSALSYWSNTQETAAEVDFLIQLDDNIIPIEVKSSINLKAKSLGVFIDKYNPKIAVRTSMSNYKLNDSIVDIPLYMIGDIDLIVDDI